MGEKEKGEMTAHQRMTTPRILDPCCGSRMFYFDRNHPDVLFGELRRETVTVTPVDGAH